MRNQPREWSQLRKIKSLVQRHSPAVLVGLGDDAFVFKSNSEEQVWCQDLMIEDIHFQRRYCSATDLGFKSLAVNLSDFAAMGATPQFVQVSLALPKNLTESWLDEFYESMTSLADRYQVEIVGGDLAASPGPLFIDVSVMGSCPKSFTREGAQPGDLLLTSGPLGLSHAGLLCLQKNMPQKFPQACTRHLRPEPRLDLVPELQQHSTHVRALMDCSDGLINDALQLCGESVGLTLDLNSRAPHPEIIGVAKLLNVPVQDFFLWGGEDYELLLVVPENARQFFPQWQILGQFQKEKGIFLQENNLRHEVTEFKGWQHF